MPSDSKKISTIIPSDLIRQIDDSGLTQTKAVLEALEYYFSPDRKQILAYKQQILEDSQKIAILEARLGEFETLKTELNRAHQLLDDQRELSQAHLAQVQTLIIEMKNERILKEDIIRKKEEKILLLEGGKKKKKWWERFLK